MSNIPDTLLAMAETAKEREATYGDNYKRVGAVLKALFPDGITLNTEKEFMVFHLLNMKLAKTTRFVCTQMTHKDSIHDDAVYSAMIETLL